MHILFAKFEAIFEQMPGELMVHKSTLLIVAGWGDMIDRLITSYLNYDSGLVEKDCLFIFIIFHGQYLTNKWYN